MTIAALNLASNTVKAQANALIDALDDTETMTMRIDAILSVLGQSLMDVLEQAAAKPIAEELGTILQLHSILTEYHEKLTASIQTAIVSVPTEVREVAEA